jgi:hypothetical protein
MAATLGSSVDSMETSCSSYQQSGAANNLPPINDIGIHKFYELIGKHPPGGQGHEETANEPTEPPAKNQKKATEHVFGRLKAFTDVLESILKEVEGNGS